MTKFKLFILVAVLCYCQDLFAQQHIFSGRIYNQQGEPLPGANIVIDNGAGTSADAFGNFKFKLPAGTFTVTVSFIGYESQQQEIEITDSERRQDFFLKQGDIELADVVITSEEVKSLSSISAYDIKLRPTESSQDVLRLVPGLFIAQHAGGGKAEQIFLRGFDIDHGTDINLTVDGMPVNMVSHAHGQGYSDLHFLIPETIQRVNFNKGPYYVDQGNFTTAGYAAFHTRDRLDSSMIKLEGGQYGTLRTVGLIDLLNRQQDGLRENLYIASELYLTDGYFDSDQNFSRINIMGKYTGYFDDKKLLSISASRFTSKWDASGQIPVRAVESGLIGRFGAIDDTEGGETSRTNLNVKYNLDLGNDAGLEHQVFFSRYDFMLVSNFTFFLNDPINGDQITQSESRSIYGYSGAYTKDGYLGNLGIRSKAGAGFRYDDVNDIRLSHTLNRKEVLDDLARGDVDETNVYAYISETLDITPAFSVNGSLRYDHFIFNYVDALATTYERQSESEGTFSPKLSASYKLTSQFGLFAKAGIGFHSNDTRVVVAQNGKDILPKAYGFDFGGFFKPVPNLSINAAVWQLNLDQEFVYVGDEGIVEPSGETRRRGVDLSFRYQLLQWLYLDADLNFTDPLAVNEPEGADHIPLAPTFTSIGGISFNMKNGINGSLRYRYLGDRPANEDNSVEAEGYFLLDATLNYTQPKYEVGFSIVNLLDNEWKEAQFDTESRLFNETAPVSEIHFTPGSPLFARASISFFF
ncbi:TonB-dependent receptor [Fulvivirga kasyanovii]|uniref:TonB-dependent receptor n=1 Tax=Fulvivirga kasyanovii TaxID=396812 RepID=A0ABW9RV81_9BACT|nr:TonB-dependent receptor [Fulvivirga kasyanovii]MTI28118.1 TonB-dependent receptor [Fulvivirga kasyanovii]